MNINPNQIHSITVLGCGGTGSHIAAGLARLQIAVQSLDGKFPAVRLCDPDIVELPNVGRQLYGRSDIGVNKATALANRINLNYGFEWTASDVDGTSHLNIVCVDSRRARHAIYAKSASTYRRNHYIDCGNEASTGQVILGGSELPLPNKAFPTLTDRRLKDDNTPSCSLAEALEHQELFINQAIATYALQLVWSIFRYGNVNCRGYFINLNGSTQPIKF